MEKESFIKRHVILLLLVCIIVVSGFWIFLYYYLTGVLPNSFISQSDSILPPSMKSGNVTFEQLMNFIKNDDTDTIEYGTGFNCVDASLRLWRNAQWNGIEGYLVAVQYDEQPGHMVVGFPTVDKRDIWIEPQNDGRVLLQVGHPYNFRIVRGLYLLYFTNKPLGNSPDYNLNLEAK